MLDDREGGSAPDGHPAASTSELTALPAEPHGERPSPSAAPAEPEDLDELDDNPDPKEEPKPSIRSPRRGARAQANQVTLLPHGLPPLTTTLQPQWADLFFRFCAERHSIWERRLAGLPREEWTTDETMAKTFVGNVFRELDGGSIRVKDEVVGKGDKSHEEICFRLFLYCAFYKETTWQVLCAASSTGVPRWADWKTDLPAFEAALYRLSMVEKQKIYTGGFQIVPPTIYFGRSLPHFAASLRFVQTLMESGMPSRLLGLRYAVDASSILQTAPTLGGFLSLNLLCYLNTSPHLSYQYRNFASCGPGARGFLQRIFGKEAINSVAMEEAGLRWLYEHQWAYWYAIGVSPPHAWTIGLRPGMRVLDFENALCWCHRYVNDYLAKGYGSQADKPALPVEIPGLATSTDPTRTWAPPAWVPERQHAEGVSKVAWADDYDELAAQVPAVEGDEEGVYEVERIVARKGSRGDRDGLFRVRWKGYTPEEDTWERESSLKEGSQEALEEWLTWEKGVWDTIARITREQPYTGPGAAAASVKREPATPASPARVAKRHAPPATLAASDSGDSGGSVDSGSTAPSTPLRTPRTPRVPLEGTSATSSTSSITKGSARVRGKRSAGRPRKAVSSSTTNRPGAKFASDEEAEDELDEREVQKRPRRAAAIAAREVIIVGLDDGVKDELDVLDELDG